ncbi:MAG TPA: carbonic anhydrase [Longimicrobiaceae bacterium]|nr:carbonic anhydrase [Longimicrobiaceae bacterium]
MVAPRGPVRDPGVALERLQEGNQRYVAGQPLRFRLDEARRIELAEGQTPIATVFACVDSRVPVERVFDQAHGELLVIRTAAHVLDDVALGSIEFGVAQLSTPLVLVLGHQRCGAVAAAISFAQTGARARGNIQTIVERIGPAVEASRARAGDHLENAVRTHSRMTTQRLGESTVIGPTLQDGRVRIVPAYYSMHTGRVEFLTT